MSLARSLTLSITVLICTWVIAKAQTIVQPSDTVFLPIIKADVTPTPTQTPTATPTATPTITPTATLYPHNPNPESVAIRPYDVPPGFSIYDDTLDEEAPDIHYAGGWDSWYTKPSRGFGSRVRKYWTPEDALAGYQRITTFYYSNDFYDNCDPGTRAEPGVPGADTYTAIQCQKSTFERTIYLATYDNIVLVFEFAAPFRAPDIALSCEKLMAQRALGQPEDFTCRTYLSE